MNSSYLVFAQMSMFASEVMRMINEKLNVSVEDVCDHIDVKGIVKYIKTSHGFKNINVSVENIQTVNGVLKNKFVNENEARKVGIENNGLVYLLWLINDDTNRLLYNMKFNDIGPDEFRD